MVILVQFVGDSDVAVLCTVALVPGFGAGGFVGTTAGEPDGAKDEDAEVGEAGADYGDHYFA